MRRFVDLHTHSIASDGQLTPAELIDLAEAKRLAAVALTDHDTIDGLAEARRAARRHAGLRFVGGIEVSAKFPTGTLHILGLGIDETSASVGRLCDLLVAARAARNPKIIARLNAMGMAIDMDDVLAVARQHRVIGRLHIAEALRRKKYVRTADEAFQRYIGNGGPAYVDKERLDPRDAIAAIRQAGGVAALAHPPQLKYLNRPQLVRILRGLIRDGLDGLEVYHSDHSDEQTRLYLDLARQFSLEITGGSDFHGPVKPTVKLGCPRVPVSVVSPLLLGEPAHERAGRPGRR